MKRLRVDAARALELVRLFSKFFFPQVFSSLFLLICVLTSYNFRINSVVWSPDGKQIASGSQDKTIKILDSQSGDCRSTLTRHRYATPFPLFLPHASLPRTALML